MMGAIAGDIIGQPYEGAPHKSVDFPLFLMTSRFTDDTVLTVAVADCLMNDKDYTTAFKQYGREFMRAGWGASFFVWMMSDEREPYNSFGNGSAMRVSPVAWGFDSWDEVLAEAARTAVVTHDHPEGIKGAIATAGAVYLARTTKDKGEILDFLANECGYDMDRTLAEIRPGYRFDVTCQGSVPEAMIAFFEAENYEQAVRNAISLGGDADTQACIAGAVAEAFWGVPDAIYFGAWNRLPASMQKIIVAFEEKFGLPFPSEREIFTA